MALSLTSTVAIAACNAIASLADSGSTNPAATIRIYSGTPPEDVNASLSSNDVLALITMNTTAFDTAVDNAVLNVAEAPANSIVDAPALEDGVATFYRLFNRDDNAIWQGTVTEPNLGGDIELSSTSVTTGINVVVQSFYICVPK